MKIDVMALMRDEIQILPYFLRHYEQFADRIIVFDDKSVDGTRELLEAHPLVEIREIDFHGADDVYYVQSIWPQYKTISRGHADWCIQCDADEFVFAPNIRDILAYYKKNNICKVRMKGFTMWSEMFPTTTGQIYEEVTQGWPDKWQEKTILFDPKVRIKHTNGRHYTYHSQRYPTHFSTDIRILHFRCLGIPYVVNRIKKNYRNMNLPYEPWKHHNLPDKSRGPIIDFIVNKKHLLVDAINTPLIW